MFEFVVAMRDAVSSNAKKAAESTRSLATAQSRMMAANEAATVSALELNAALAARTATGAQLALLTEASAKADLELAAAQEAVAVTAQEAAVATGEEGMTSALAKMVNPAALATMAIVALAAGAAAIIGVLYEGSKAALDAAESHRKLLASLTALGGGVSAGRAALNMIRDLEKEVPQNEAQLSEWARMLMAAGVTDMSKLHDQMVAIASAEALVEGGGAKVETLLARMAEIGGTKVKNFNLGKLKGTGITQEEFLKQLGMTPQAMAAAVKYGKLTGTMVADALTRALKEKGAGPLAASLDDLSVQWAKFKDNVMKLFEKVNVKPFLEALHNVLGIFDQSTASGKTFQRVITWAFDAIFKVAAKVLPYVKAFLLQIAINFLKFKIAMTPVIAEFQRLVATKPNSDSLNWAKDLGDMMTAALPMIALVARQLVVIFGIFQRLSGIADTGKSIGSGFVDGLVRGIEEGVSRVIGAATGLMGSLVNAAKQAAGVHSPSVVMRQMGLHMTAGLHQGLERGAPGPSRAMLELATPPEPRRMQPAPVNNTSSKSMNVTIHLGAGDSPQETAKIVKAAMADCFEQWAATQGA